MSEAGRRAGGSSVPSLWPHRDARRAAKTRINLRAPRAKRAAGDALERRQEDALDAFGAFPILLSKLRSCCMLSG